MMAVIRADHLIKVFTVAKKQPGLRGALRGLVAPNRSRVTAVDDVSFEIQAGEIVGYLGPNGAGKSTTIKMLTGILYPTAGTVQVLGRSPQTDRQAVVRNLGVVFGQRSQLYWDLRLGETFELLRRVYRIDAATYRENVQLVSEVLGIESFIDVPVRQLSLGMRMRGELAAAFLHAPPILFLDEPTIGLDFEAKQSVLDFIRLVNRTRNTTIILTTHNLNDVEQICQRLIVIDGGKIVEDQSLALLVDKFAPYRILIADFHTPPETIDIPHVQLAKREGTRCWMLFDRAQLTAADLMTLLLQRYPIRDISVQEPAIEDVIKAIYGKSAIKEKLS